MPLRICFIASEAAPLAKTGGLADVSGALTKYLHEAGHDIRLFMPLYDSIGRSSLEISPVERLRGLAVRLGPHQLTFDVRAARLPGSTAPVYLVDAPAFYGRGRIYTTDADEHLRFILLTHAALVACQHMAFAPDILHCNDWHTGLGPLLVKTVYAWDRLFQGTRSLMSIHNLAYQGVFSAAHVADTGLGDSVHRLDGTELAAGRVNLMREGITHADAISTVSPTYAREIQTPEHGHGLDGLLRQRAAAISGILNGVDIREWNPATDRYLPRHFSAGRLTGKAELRRQFARERGLVLPPRRRVPLVGMVSRFASQKGLDLVMKVLPRLMEKHEFACGVLGSGEARYEEFFRELAAKYPKRVSFVCGYSEAEAHWIEAASDIFLMPSLYEPCGLNQMYSQIYGTIPVVRRTGGLADSVQHFDPPSGTGTGVVFNDYDEGGLTWGFGTALAWYAKKPLWQKIIANAMAQDFSWERRVGEYVALYERIRGT
ncbi:MAG: glycogen synthase [Pseudomonadota bacterium]|jgi:starch synthase|nr:MAG: glycogen synthase GlgA [Pseudomonadota bacterium]